MSTLSDIVIFANQVTESITSAVVIPLLIFFAAIIIGKVIHVLLKAFLRSVEFNTHAKKVFTHRADYAELASGGVAAIIYTVGTVWALVEAGIIILALQIVGIFLGVLAIIALMVWLFDLLPNLFAYRKVVKKFSVGDELSVSGVSGKILHVGWLAVTISTDNKLIVVIPHRTIKARV